MTVSTVTEPGLTERTFTPYDIQNCLYDAARVDYFRRAIAAVVKPGDIVIDAGSGTGVLGLFAAQAGAAKVYCIEIDREYVQVINENARLNRLQDKIVAVHGNAAEMDLDDIVGAGRQVDVIVSEVISGGLFYEPQLQIIDNLQRFLKPAGKVIPGVMTNQVELIHAQDELYGLKFAYDTRHQILNGDRALTTRETYLQVDFREETPLHIRESAVVRAQHTATANAVRIPYTLQFSDDVEACEPTEFLLNPQTIFLPAAVRLVEGRAYRVSLDYQSGESPLNAKIEVEELA